MVEQQYTCPSCKKNYVRCTIHEHYGCGVKPLDASEKDADEIILAHIEQEMNPSKIEIETPIPKKRGPKPKPRL